jgi:hypothetical protein
MATDEAIIATMAIDALEHDTFPIPETN